MNAIEKRIQDLYNYSPDRTAKQDLWSFWSDTLRTCEAKPLNDVRREKPSSFRGIRVWSVQFEGFDETKLHGDLIVPEGIAWAGAKGGDEAGTENEARAKDGERAGLPCVVTFPGYSSGRSLPIDYAPWLLSGAAVFSIDVRGQGGETGNLLGSPHGMAKGWASGGILDLARSYYMAITVDAWKAVQWAARQPEIDSSRIAVAGASQGGGLALLTAALSEQVKLCVADVPNMCHMDFGLLHSVGSLSELADYCRRFPEQLPVVLDHLSYFDMLNLAERLDKPVMMSVGLKDTICWPEQIFPVYQRIPSELKRLEIYPFTGHAVESLQRQKDWAFVQDHL